MKVKEARTKEERKHVRKKLGSLKSLTVQPKTKERYQLALNSFFKYLRHEQLQLPTRRDGLDEIVSDYLEYLWAEGEGRAAANNLMAGLQDYDPKLKGHLPGSWRLLKTWTTQEVPQRAPPLTYPILKAMVGWSIFNHEYSFGLSLLVAFHGLLRTGELLALQAHQVHMTSVRQPAVLSLGLTKSGKRVGAAESITLTDSDVLKWLWEWKLHCKEHEFLTAKPHIWRQMFSRCTQELKIQEWSFRPYSLRRGGATSLFVKTGNLDRVILAGRWTALKTARIYLNSGLAMLADLTIPSQLLKPFHLVFHNFLKTQPKLEPAIPQRKGRAGGRGKTARKKPKWCVCPRGVGFGFCF